VEQGLSSLFSSNWKGSSSSRHCGNGKICSFLEKNTTVGLFLDANEKMKWKNRLRAASCFMGTAIGGPIWGLEASVLVAYNRGEQSTSQW